MADMKQLFAEVFSVNNATRFNPETFPEDEIKIYLYDVNDELSRFDFEIGSIHDQHDRSEIFALVNLASDTFIQSATHHSADEIAYFRRLLDAMFDTNNQPNAEVFAVKRRDAEKLHKAPREETGGNGQATTAGKGLTMFEAQQALATFVEEGWLERSKKQWYSLTPRALLELSEYLKRTYNPDPAEADRSDRAGSPAEELIRFCYLCKEILTVGQRCDDFKCPLRMHNPCAKVLFERSDSDPQCPKCKKSWSGESPVGEKAEGKLHIVRGSGRRAVAAQKTSQAQKAGQKSNESARRGRARVEDDEDENEDEEEQEDDDDEQAEGSE